MKGRLFLRQPVFRFAPSPNGYLHLGHAFSALLNLKMARETAGRFLLRIEDIDIIRSRSEFEHSIYEDLAWLGLEWEMPVRRQSDHFADYSAALQRLASMGLIYPSFLSRMQIRQAVAAKGQPWPNDPLGVPLYPGNERDLDPAVIADRAASGENHALRLNMKKALAIVGTKLTWTETGSGKAARVTCDPAAWGDVILARKETPTSYHLSVTVDDALQGITHVVRGMDLYHSTSIHRLLQTLLDYPEPVYHHHRLISGDNSPKLSKSAHAPSLRDMRMKGITAAEIREKLGF